jgi:hypothetical protein
MPTRPSRRLASARRPNAITRNGYIKSSGIGIEYLAFSETFFGGHDLKTVATGFIEPSWSRDPVAENGDPGQLRQSGQRRVGVRST